MYCQVNLSSDLAILNFFLRCFRNDSEIILRGWICRKCRCAFLGRVHLAQPEGLFGVSTQGELHARQQEFQTLSGRFIASNKSIKVINGESLRGDRPIQ
jgi:hypothetical protein